MKTRIGHLLTRDNLVSEAQLARALEVQNFAGGRIGTLLLERGVLGEDDLGRTLALQHGCGYIPWSVLADIPPETIAVLPARFALKHGAIPYERGEGYVRMALRDPSDLRVFDELVFVTGRKVFVGVAPEVRIFQALEKYYGKLRAPRFALLAEKLSRAMRPRPGPPPPPDFFAEAPGAPDLPLMTPSKEEETALFFAPAEELPPQPPAPAAPPRTTPPAGSERPSPVSPFGWTLGAPARREPPEAPEAIPWEDTTGRSKRAPAPAAEELPPFEEVLAFEHTAFEPLEEAEPETPPDLSEERFPAVASASGRDAIADAVLEALVRRFRSAAIFACRSEGVAGWVAAGEHVNLFGVRSFSVSWTDPSIFLNVRLSRTFYLGPLPVLPRHDQLAAALGGWPGECAVQPVFIGEKPVAFLLVTAPRPGTVTARDLAYLRDLSETASVAFANAIRLRKREI